MKLYPGANDPFLLVDESFLFLGAVPPVDMDLARENIQLLYLFEYGCTRSGTFWPVRLRLLAQAELFAAVFSRFRRLILEAARYRATNLAP